MQGLGPAQPFPRPNLFIRCCVLQQSIKGILPNDPDYVLVPSRVSTWYTM